MGSVFFITRSVGSVPDSPHGVNDQARSYSPPLELCDIFPRVEASPSLTPGDRGTRCPCCGAISGALLLARADLYGLPVAIRCVDRLL